MSVFLPPMRSAGNGIGIKWCVCVCLLGGCGSDWTVEI